MRKSVLVIAALLGVAAAAWAIFAALGAGREVQESLPPVTQNLDVTIGDQTFTLVDGVAVKESAPGSASSRTVRVLDEAVDGDFTGDGKPDAALVISDDPGGSGTFYYAVLAVNDGRSWRATNALPLGDRIKPESIDFVGGRFVYRYLERKPGEAMADAPTVEKVLPIRFDATSGRISAG